MAYEDKKKLKTTIINEIIDIYVTSDLKIKLDWFIILNNFHLLYLPYRKFLISIRKVYFSNF